MISLRQKRELRRWWHTMGRAWFEIVAVGSLSSSVGWLLAEFSKR